MSLWFGEFELDREQRQLLRSGRPVPLEPKAYELVCLLVERRPRALSRAQIRDVVWPETFISESTLGVVVNNLRQALGDDAKQPRFIRTVRGFGYSFCGEVNEDAALAPDAGSDAPPVAAPAGERGRRRWPLFLALVPLAIAGAVWLLMSRGAPSTVLPSARTVPLTNLPGWEESPALSPDGTRVAFSWEGEAGDNRDIYVKQVGTEALLRLTHDPGDDFSPAWSPDGGYISFSRQTETELAYLSVPALGGPERRVHALPGERAPFGAFLDWSPDGKLLAIEDHSADEPQGIVLVSLETLEAARPPALTRGRAPAFSPDGRHLAFIRTSASPGSDIHVVAVSGGEPRQLTFSNRWVGGLAWTRDGREIVFSSNRAGLSGLWRVASSGAPPSR